MQQPPAVQGDEVHEPSETSKPDDGFFKVTRRTQNRRHRPVKQQGDHSASGGLPAEITHDELSGMWNKARDGWAKDETRPGVEKLFDNHCGSRPCGLVKKFIIFGLGTLTAEQQFIERRLWQLAIGLDIVNTLQHLGGTSAIQIYAQEPIFNARDKTFLESLGVKVLEDPTAFDMIDDTTFVYGPHFPLWAWLSIMLNEEAVFSLIIDVEKTDVSDCALVRHQFVAGREKLRFPRPQGTHLEVLNDMMLYWVKSDEDD
ncbi:MAG: hypothetical protein M1828_000259 [Chrysothrix sp. TS-e1954]|nr:MAG: hypothetical protein M1828_000259 [Chrysothrix sp. TS-e1954]